MPRGRHAKDTPPEFDYDLRRLNDSQQYTMNEELLRKGSEARQKILDGFDDTLAKIQELANGIVVHETVKSPNGKPGPVCHNCGEPVTERIYRVPPYWPALRWLGEWGRLIVKEDQPAARVEHDYPPELMEALRAYVNADKQVSGYLPARVNGVITLED